jgi:hypothetical protein
MIAEFLTLLALAVTVVVLVYTLSMFKDWVRTNVGNLRNRQIVSGLVRERLENGDYKIIPFLYDQENKDVLENQVYQTKLIDEELEERFENDDVLIEPISQKG